MIGSAGKADMEAGGPSEAHGTGCESIHVLTLNCWGLKFISKHRAERLSEIGNRLKAYSPALDIVGLQECWTYSDYLSIRKSTRGVLPFAKFYYSGIFGGGLAIFSKWPIEDASMFRYPLNGRPTAFFRGDWFVGKGVACAKIRMPDDQVIEVFNTHLHAPYEKEPNDSYLCHRTAQAWEIAKLMKAASERGSLVIGLGDFNMIPLSFAHVLIESRGDVRDAWRVLKPASSIGASVDQAEKSRRLQVGAKKTPDVRESLQDHGHTCDTVVNTWRWNKAHQKALAKGQDREIGPSHADPQAKRLDYVFVGGIKTGWKVEEIRVTMTERHPTLLCSLSDHLAVEATIVRSNSPMAPLETLDVDAPLRSPDLRRASADIVSFQEKDYRSAIAGRGSLYNLEASFYEDILTMIETYTLRERKQRRWRLAHFVGSSFVSIGSFVAIWWSPHNFVAFILLLLSTFGIMAGTVDGLIGGLFVGSELRALSEFEWEVRNALELAGGPKQEDKPLLDWYD